MLYRAEVMKDSMVINSGTYEATHPNQVLRRVLAPVIKKKLYDFMSVYIMNQNGESWVYGVVKKDRKYKVSLLFKDEKVIPKHIMFEIIAGNKPLSEVM